MHVEPTADTHIGSLPQGRSDALQQLAASTGNTASDAGRPTNSHDHSSTTPPQAAAGQLDMSHLQQLLIDAPPAGTSWQAADGAAAVLGTAGARAPQQQGHCQAAGV